ncbi:MAG: alanine--tRNA ligase [Deltaproteobacteria bacterium]|nr:alanine--tRNA ligase [Deltaproteobacteria bacterium]
MTKRQWTGQALRQSFLTYFSERQSHTLVPSAPLVPQGDATLLFVNAGMVQFKDVFTGQEKRDYVRATSSQKCVRAGGKHNDLENVGRTARHHTFFEMLGNFSFGDYFKEDACTMAWDYLTNELGLDEKRLTVTVFGGENGVPADEEAERIWHEVVGVPMAQISRLGAADNFWSMGDTGPCGPCSEIHYDRGQVDGSFGGDDPEGDQVLEVWNLVFMQYERHANGSMTDLPAPSVDTGMGLERLAMVMNGCASNYDTDLLRPMITFCEEKLGKKYTSTDSDDDVAMRVIADHARTTVFLMGDGVLPDNVGRGYVLKAIMRRAILFGDLLGFNDLFFHQACEVALDLFKDAYPELEKTRSLVEKAAKSEENAFRATLGRGLERFAKITAGLDKGGEISGEDAFDLHQTFGFPIVMTELMAQEKGFVVDMKGFHRAQKKHEEVSKGGGLGVGGAEEVFKTLRQEHGTTSFTGYEKQVDEVKVIALLRADTVEEEQEVTDKKGKAKKKKVKMLSLVPVDMLQQGEKGRVLTESTPFYGESGGQVGDTGIFFWDDSDSALNVAQSKINDWPGKVTIEVFNTTKESELHVHQVVVKEGSLKVGQKVQAQVNEGRLTRIKRNHSATHLLHLCLREILGDHVAQKGSVVDEGRLRFDFSHFEAVTDAQIAEVEDNVNGLILGNVSRETEEMAIDAAREKGAMALFGEKYDDEVRVVSMGPSVELCGGLHVERTGDIGCMRITSEGPLAAGIRRIEAVTGTQAFQFAREQGQSLKTAAQLLQSKMEEVPSRIEKLQDELKATEKELERLHQKAAAAAAKEAVAGAFDVGGVKVLAQNAVNVDGKGMRDYADKLRDQLGSGVVVLGKALSDDKCTLLVALTKDLVGRLHAGNMVKELASVVGGKGGGRPDFAQAGGTNPAQLDAALQKVSSVVEGQL